MSQNNDIFSAGPQSLGYQYQPRYGLLRMMELPEDTALLIERDYDLDFTVGDDAQTLASLKHKAPWGQTHGLEPGFLEINPNLAQSSRVCSNYFKA